ASFQTFMRRNTIHGLRPKTIWDREIGLKTGLKTEDVMNGSEVMEKLDIYKEAGGHEGCVNTLKWNLAGSLLASGSDDTRIKLWDVDGHCQCTYETSHTGNIFGVEFIPGMSDRFIMSCAGDGNVILIDLETKDELSKWTTRGRVKSIASCTYSPKTCWSISEDKFVRRHDCRAISTDVNFKIGYNGKSIAASDLHPHWLAIGSESTHVLIFDTRNTRRPLMEMGPLDKRPQDPFYITHVTFAKKSNMLLANYGRGSTYLFDLDESSRESVFCRKLDEFRQWDINSYERPMHPPISPLVQSTVDQVQLLFSNLQYSHGFLQLNTLLQRHDLSAIERASILLLRSKLFTGRKWEGDSYSAAQDALCASIILPFDPEPTLRLIAALESMEQTDICLEIINLFKTRFPDRIDEVKAREKSLNAISAPNRRTRNLRRNSTLIRDYFQRYAGYHVNQSTDIKEAAFFGPSEEFIMCGSDSGHIVVYNRENSSVATLLKADSSIVNVIQPHPSLPLIASSGLDKKFVLFAPFNHSCTPLMAPLSRRVHFSAAEPIMTRLSTRNLVRDIILLNRLGIVEHQQCQVS
ncbi:hypothetical protein PFISCL1PPCAC_19915, partial [Pristionchus fissidentatus]